MRGTERVRMYARKGLREREREEGEMNMLSEYDIIF